MKSETDSEGSLSSDKVRRVLLLMEFDSVFIDSPSTFSNRIALAI